MTIPAGVPSDTPMETPVASTAPLSAVRPFYWSVRRELWEHRSIYFAPMAAAGVVLFGFLLGMMIVTHVGHARWSFDPERQGHAIVIPYYIAAIAILSTSLIVALVYCLGALHNERRDRSILFWKSLPVSDLTAVLSKATIPLVVLPVVTLVVILATQLVMLLLNITALLLHGVSAGPLLAQLFQSPLDLPYALAVLALWHAPVYGWLLLVSAWAKRAPFLWAVLPPLGLCLLEKIAFDTSHLASIVGRRLMGGLGEGFTSVPGAQDMTGGSPQMDPIGFLTNPGLWVGLAVTAAFLAAAVWVRRYREPI